MPGVNVLRFLVDEIDESLKYWDVLRVYRATVSAGPFTEITTAATRPALTTAPVYTYSDPGGTADSWYQFDLFDTTGVTDPSARSTAVQADGNDADSVITPDELRQEYLFGLNTQGPDGTLLPDHIYRKYIAQAIAYAEHELDLPIRTRTFDDTAADARFDSMGGGSARLDLIRPEYRKHIWLQLDHHPVLSIEEIKMTLPTSQDIITYESDWIYPDLESGQVMIVPHASAASLISLGSASVWLATAGGWADLVPDIFRIKYTAGLGYPTPSDVRHLIGMLATIPILDILGDLILGAGIAEQRLVVDGLVREIKSTASATASGYSARIISYRKQIKELMKTLHRYYKGIRFASA